MNWAKFKKEYFRGFYSYWTYCANWLIGLADAPPPVTCPAAAALPSRPPPALPSTHPRPSPASPRRSCLRRGCGVNPRAVLLWTSLLASLASSPPPLVADPSPSPGPPLPDPGGGADLAGRCAALLRHLSDSPPPTGPFTPRPAAAALPRIYGWISTPRGRRRVKCLLDSGASHCFIRPELAGQLGPAWSRSPRGGPLAVRQADGQTRSTLGSVDVLLQLGDLSEETLFTVFDLECDADLILGFSWLRDHGLSFLYADEQVSFCAEAGCTSGRMVRLDLAQASSSSAGAPPVLRGQALLRMIRTAGLEVPRFSRPSACQDTPTPWPLGYHGGGGCSRGLGRDSLGLAGRDSSGAFGRHVSLPRALLPALWRRVLFPPRGGARPPRVRCPGRRVRRCPRWPPAWSTT